MKRRIANLFLALATSLVLLFASVRGTSVVTQSVEDSSAVESKIKESLLEKIITSNELLKKIDTAQENTTSGVFSLRRHLAVGDFDEFNELFQGATIRLPDTTVEERIIGIQLTLKLTNIRCTEIRVGDILITYNRDSNQRLSCQVDVVDLDLTCYLDYRYDYGFLGGNGNAVANTDNNQAIVAFAFTSADFDQSPPNDVNMESCTADINVIDLDFDGDWISSILDVMERLIRGTVEGQIQSAACTELASLADGGLQNILVRVSDLIVPYLAPLTVAATDPLLAERNLAVPPDLVLVNFRETEETVGKWFKTVLNEADQLLGTSVNDQGGPTGTNRDLGVNVFLRDYLLDSDRAFTVNVDDLPFDFDGVLFEGHDKLTQTTITLNQVKLYGLDTFTRFEPLSDIGNYTLQNELGWEYLTVELDLDIVVKPSTLPDAMLENPADVLIDEKVKISFGVDNVDAIVSVLLAVDQTALGSLQLGPLLDLDSLVSCLLSIIFDVQISGLDVTIGNVREPTLDGFVSPGIDRIVSRTIQALFLMYENLLLSAMPNIFQTTVRDLLNDNFDLGLQECPELDFGNELIDFRDLFLKADVAAAAGGTGEEPYGSVASTLFSLLQDQVTVLGSDGLPKINSLLLRPFMESQSGAQNLLWFPGDVFTFARDDISSGLGSSLADSFELSLYNTRILNLDTIIAPLSIMQPSTGPQLLTNLVNVGPVAGRPINGTMSLRIALDGDDSPLQMTNELDISASIDGAVFIADILARISANPLMQFPLRDVLNLNCWLSVFDTPTLDAEGFRVDPSAEAGLALNNFLLTLMTLSMEVNCVSCTSPGVAAIPVLLDILRQEGSFRILRTRIEKFAAELLLSEDLLQIQIDRLLSEAPKSCPHRPEYVENAVSTDYGGPVFPALSKDSVEAVIYTASLAAQVGLVVFAESHASYNVSSSDYLSGQNALEVPPGTRLVDFTSLGDTVGSWFDTALEEVNGYLGGMVEDVGGPNGDEDLGINVGARSLLLDDDRTLSIDISDVGFEAGKDGEMRIDLDRLRVKGLDTFTAINAFDPVAPQTIRNLVSLRELDVEVDVTIRTPDDTGTLTISFGVDGIDAAVSLLLAIDIDRIGALEMGSLLFMDRILPCFLSSAIAVELTELSVTVDNVRGPDMDGYLSDYLQSAVTNTTRAIFDENNFRQSMKDAIPGIFDVTLRAVLNNWMNYYLSQESSVSCPKFEIQRKLQSVLRFIDFRDMFLPSEDAVALGGSGTGQYGDLLRVVRGLLTDEVLKVDPATGKSAINDFLIAPLTKSQSGEEGTLAYEGNLLDVGTNIDVGGLKADFQLGVYNARIENLDAVGDPLSVLDPVYMKPQELNNSAGFGVGPNPLRFAATVLLVLEGKGDMQIRNEVDISVDLSSATIVLGLLLKIAESPFVSFPLRDFTNVNCWLATIPAPELDASGVRVNSEDLSAALADLVIAIDNIGLNVTCISCSGPDMEEFTELLSSPEANQDLNEAASNVINLVSKFLTGEFSQIQINRLLAEAPKKCPHREEYQENYVAPVYEEFETESASNDSIQFLITLVIIAACFAFAVLFIGMAVRWLVRRRHRMWLRSLPGRSVFILFREQKFQTKKEAELNCMSKSMFLSNAIPCSIRYLMPVIILGNIALFLSGHLSLGATVNIQMEFAGQEFVVDKFFEFSMARSVFDIWEAGGKELAILLLIFSGVWPYTKQIITLVLWFAPPTWVSTSRRGSILLWLDILAKWSMVDIFSLVVTIAAFRVTVESPDVSFLPENFYTISLLVIPLWGLYANMIAQLVSQVSSHYIIHYHRRIVEAAEDEQHALSHSGTDITDDMEADCRIEPTESQTSAADTRKERLCDHSFARPHRGRSDKLQTRRMVNPLIMFLTVSMTVLIIVGVILPTFSVELLGLLGVAVESGQGFQQANTNYNLFNIVKVLIDEAKFLGGFGNYLGLGFLSVLLIVTVLLVPMAQSVLLMRQWFRPLNARAHRRTEVAIEILAAWQYVEVYLLSAIVGAWQLGPVSEFFLNDYCDGLSSLFSSLVFYGVLEPVDAQCFRAETRIENGSFVLIAGAVLLAFLNTYVNKAFMQYLRDKSEATILQDDPKLANEGSENWEGESVEEAMTKIHPAPVLFTDTFRWLLIRQDVKLSQRTAGLSTVRPDSINDQSTLGVTSGFPESPTVSFKNRVGNHSPSTLRSVYMDESDADGGGNTVDFENLSYSESIMDIESEIGDDPNEHSTRLALGVALGLPVTTSPHDKDIVFKSSEDSSSEEDRLS